jgi:hypothetical protein
LTHLFPARITDVHRTTFKMIRVRRQNAFCAA